MLAELLDETTRVGQCFPAGEMNVVTQGFPPFFFLFPVPTP